MEHESGIFSCDLEMSPSSSSAGGDVFENLINLESPDWRMRCKSLSTKLKFAFESENIPRDISFNVGVDSREIIHAHKFILQLSSKKFCELLEDDANNFTIDVHPDVFKFLLKFIYTEEADFQDVDCNFLLSLAKLITKYEILTLAALCCGELLTRITIEYAMDILELAIDIGHKLLLKSTLHFIYRNTHEILESGGFLKSRHATVCTLLRSDHLNVDELTIFSATYKWAKSQCCNDAVELSPKNIREKLGELKNLVRYPLITPDDFVTTVCSTGILNAEEKSDILQYFCVSEYLKRSFRPKLFSCRPRIHSRGSVDERYNQNEIYSGDLLKRKVNCNGENTELILRDVVLLDLNQLVSDVSSLGLKIRKNVQNLQLINIQLENFKQLSITKCIRVANLKSFHLSLIMPPSANDNDKQKFVKMVQNQLPRFLFFTKKSNNYPWPFAFSSLWQQNVNIEVIVCSQVLLKMDHLKGIVIANNLLQTPLILKSVASTNEVQILAIAFNSPIQTEETLNPVESVSKLTIHGVKYLPELHRFLQGFANLTEVVFQDCGYKELNLDSIVERNQLRKITVSHAFIKSENLQAAEYYNNLGILSLWNCLWNEEFEKCFPSNFSNLRELYIYNNFMDKAMFQLLDVCLHRMKLEKVVISGYIWGTFSCLNIEQETEKLRMKNLLHELGVAENQPNICLFRNHSESRESSWASYEYTNEQISEAVYKQFNFELFSPNKEKALI